jgi:hypothetical protein
MRTHACICRYCTRTFESFLVLNDDNGCATVCNKLNASEHSRVTDAGAGVDIVFCTSILYRQATPLNGGQLCHCQHTKIEQKRIHAAATIASNSATHTFSSIFWQLASKPTTKFRSFCSTVFVWLPFDGFKGLMVLKVTHRF